MVVFWGNNWGNGDFDMNFSSHGSGAEPAHRPVANNPVRNPDEPAQRYVGLFVFNGFTGMTSLIRASL